MNDNDNYEIENENKHKKEVDGEKTPKIIILDFSSSGNNEENEEDSQKELFKNKKLKEEEKNNENKSDILDKNINDSFNKNENVFLLKKNKTKNENDFLEKKNNDFNHELKPEKKFTTPKSKNSSLLISKTNKIIQSHSYNRKLSANYGTKCIIKTSTTTKIEDFRKSNKKNKKRKSIDDFFDICASKNFNHNEDYQNRIINTKAIKENIRKRNKNKIKNKSKIMIYSIEEKIAIKVVIIHQIKNLDITLVIIMIKYIII